MSKVEDIVLNNFKSIDEKKILKLKKFYSSINIFSNNVKNSLKNNKVDIILRSDRIDIKIFKSYKDITRSDIDIIISNILKRDYSLKINDVFSMKNDINDKYLFHYIFKKK